MLKGFPIETRTLHLITATKHKTTFILELDVSNLCQVVTVLIHDSIGNMSKQYSIIRLSQICLICIVYGKHSCVKAIYILEDASYPFHRLSKYEVFK